MKFLTRWHVCKKKEKIGSDETRSDVNILEFLVREGEGRRSSRLGVGTITVFADAFDENFNFSDYF